MGYLCLFIHVLFEKTMFYLYFSLFNKNIHEVKNIAIRIVSCHTYRDTYRIVKMCIVTSLLVAILDVNTVGAVTRTTLTGFLSNLVQRESLGGPTCMPIYFLFGFKNGGMAAIFVFWPP